MNIAGQSTAAGILARLEAHQIVGQWWDTTYGEWFQSHFLVF